jgi:hypothetical protein
MSSVVLHGNGSGLDGLLGLNSLFSSLVMRWKFFKVVNVHCLSSSDPFNGHIRTALLGLAFDRNSSSAPVLKAVLLVPAFLQLLSKGKGVCVESIPTQHVTTDLRISSS